MKSAAKVQVLLIDEHGNSFGMMELSGVRIDITQDNFQIQDAVGTYAVSYIHWDVTISGRMEHSIMEDGS